jgi:hypothetical protein
MSKKTLNTKNLESLSAEKLAERILEAVVAVGYGEFVITLKLSKTHQTHTFPRVRLAGFRGPTLCLEPSERTQFFPDFLVSKLEKTTDKKINLGYLNHLCFLRCQ